MINLLGLGSLELEALARSVGEAEFRGRQLARWIFKRSVLETDAMTDLPKGFRQRLVEDERSLGVLRLLSEQIAGDETHKYLFGSAAGGTLEAVLMPYRKSAKDVPDRVTACISTQIGCAVGCVFCETGLSGFEKNVTAGEMVEQVVRMQAKTGFRISNVVFMGMGEPFLNYDETLKAVHLLNKEVGVGMRHLTISTSGIIPGIDKLADEQLQLTLAVSLHAPNDTLRTELVPINKKYPLKALRASMGRYVEKAGRRLTAEYVMLAGVNDDPSLARQLGDYLGGLPIHINLIPYNATDAKFGPSPPAVIEAFRAILVQRGFDVTVRVERGAEIDGACGQLRRRLEAGEPILRANG